MNDAGRDTCTGDSLRRAGGDMVSVEPSRDGPFASAAALETFGDDARAYELAIAAFARCGDDLALWEALTALGYDRDEIAWHVARPGQRVRQGLLSTPMFS